MQRQNRHHTIINNLMFLFNAADKRRVLSSRKELVIGSYHPPIVDKAVISNILQQFKAIPFFRYLTIFYPDIVRDDLKQSLFSLFLIVMQHV